jgi:hypothetical protein
MRRRRILRRLIAARRRAAAAEADLELLRRQIVAVDAEDRDADPKGAQP